MGTDSPRDLYFKTISYPEEKHYIRGFGNAHGISFGVGGGGENCAYNNNERLSGNVFCIRGVNRLLYKFQTI